MGETETTGENFSLKDISGVRPDTVLELGGSRVINGEKLSKAWLNGQMEMVEPIAQLLEDLVSSGKLPKEALVKIISRANRPVVSYARKEGETAETQVTRSVSARFLAILALHLSRGDIAEANDMLGQQYHTGGALTPSMEFLAEFIIRKARHTVKK